MSTYSKELEVKLLEEDREDFAGQCGLDILNYVRRKNQERANTVIGFYDFAGEYYKKPEHFIIGKDKVYKKKQYAGEISAEVILGYAYNELGIPSPIAYPFFMSTYIPYYRFITEGGGNIADGVITKDMLQVFPEAIKRGDPACHTIKGLFTDENCLQTITKKGRLARIKETLASIAFNNKDAGFDNSFWTKDDDGRCDGIVSIDHGYSGRDSIYLEGKDDVIRGLYWKGEHGYNGMYHFEEDRATVLYYVRRLLRGETIDGVTFSDDEIRELKQFIEDIARLDFKAIAKDYADRFRYRCSDRYMNGLEYSREDLCKEIGD